MQKVGPQKVRQQGSDWLEFSQTGRDRLNPDLFPQVPIRSWGSGQTRKLGCRRNGRGHRLGAKCRRQGVGALREDYSTFRLFTPSGSTRCWSRLSRRSGSGRPTRPGRAPHRGRPSWRLGSQSPFFLEREMSAESHVVERLLALLREWGWEAGSEKLRAALGEVANSAATQEVREFFQAWLAAERGDTTARAHARAMANAPFLTGWALFAEAFMALRLKEFEQAWRLLNEADGQLPQDKMRHAAVLHLRGAVRYHQGDSRQALDLLTSAKNELDDGHFGMGRVLDTMGMAYGGMGNFHAAQAFYGRAIALKRARADVAGEALTHGQLGRFYLEWGLPDQAERHFKEDLRLAKRGDDSRGEVQMYNALWQVALARGDAAKAAEWLDSCIARCNGVTGWDVPEGYARKDRALAHLAAGTDVALARADEQLQGAESRFHAVPCPFAEGLAPRQPRLGRAAPHEEGVG